jgi:hypothetical protein
VIESAAMRSLDSGGARDRVVAIAIAGVSEVPRESAREATARRVGLDTMKLAASIDDRDAPAEIQRLREQHRAQFDAFFAAHPEADELTAAFEAKGAAAGA